MAKFLSAVGRSNLAATGKGLLKQAYDIQATRTTGAKDVLAATINVGDFKQRQAEAERQEVVFAQEQKKYKENEAYLDSVVDLGLELDKQFGVGPSERKAKAEEYYTSSGLGKIDEQTGRLMASRRNAHRGVEELTSNMQFRQLVLDDTAKDYLNVIFKLREEHAKALEGGNEKAVETIGKKLEAAESAYKGALSMSQQHKNTMEKTNAEIAGRETTAKITAKSREKVAGTTNRPVYSEKDARKRRTSLINMKIKLVAGVGEFGSSGDGGAMQAMVADMLKKNPEYAKKVKLAEAAETMTVEAFQSAIDNITDEISYVERFITQRDKVTEPSDTNTLYGTTEQEAQAMEAALGPGVDIPQYQQEAGIDKVSGKVRPRGIPVGSMFLETRDGYDYWTNPDKAFKVGP